MGENWMNKLINSLRYGVFSRPWPACANFLVKAFGPKFAAYLSYLGIDWDGAKKSGKTVLCLCRESFIKDIKELRARTSINYPIVTGGFTRFQMAWFPLQMQIQTFYQLYQGEDKAAAIAKSTQYALQLIKLASRKAEVNGILSANFDYWQDVGFKNACKILEIPFIVLSREHPIIPKVCDVVTDWYQKAAYHFDGTAIAVAGLSTRDVLERAGCICKSDQVMITGLPRFDAWQDIDKTRPRETRSLVTLLTFTEGYYADETFKEVLRVFCEAAGRCRSGNIQFLVKTKDINDTILVAKMIEGMGDYPVECTHERELFEVLPDSRLVINYNSLSLVEAVMARAPIVIPAWGECKDRGAEVMYSIENPNVARVVEFAYSSDDLSQAIAASVAGNTKAFQNQDADDFINDFVHVPAHGSCSTEFEKFLLKYI